MFTWRAQEFKNFNKTNDWFWTIGLFAVLGAILAFWRGSVTFGILIILIGFIMIVFGNHKHDEQSIMVNEEGLMIDETMFLWKDVKGFKIIPDPDEPFNKKVIFNTERQFANKISLPIDRTRVNPDSLKDFLRKHISEDNELRESVAKAIAEKVRF